MSKQEHIKLAKQFAISWTGNLTLSPAHIDDRNFANHPLNQELNALLNGESASLPFLTKQFVLWITFAADNEGLEIAIEDLRAWILPSLGWEDEKSIKLPDDAPANIRGLVSVVSPSGYFRWWSKKNRILQVIEKLRAMRLLSEKRPEHIYLHIPSLFELRQQFEVALLVKDKAEAQKSIDSIDNNQLDTASNTSFMEIRLLAEFREFDKIVNHTQVNELINLRMPQNIRLVFVKAFHIQFLKEFEKRNDFAGAKQSYQNNVAPIIAGLLGLCRPTDGLEASHSLGYKAVLNQDEALANNLLEDTSDSFLQKLLTSFRSTSITSKLSPAELFQNAHQKSDWRTMQEIGSNILFDNEFQDNELPLDYLIPVLKYSLKFCANPELQERLKANITKPNLLDIPQTWLEFSEEIRAKRWDTASTFLALENRPVLENVNLASAMPFLETLQELFTDPEIESDSVGIEVLQSSLTALISEFLTAPNFPNKSLVSIYRQLMEIWVIYKNGSSHPADANLLLTLAEPVLQNDPTSEDLVTETLRNWWEARKVRALLPFLLNSLEILSENLTDIEACKNLWIDGADFVRLNLDSMSQTELEMWKFVGSNIGLDKELIDQFIEIGSAIEPNDLLGGLQNIKIAIVSLQIESARTAADLIQQRTKGDVIVVNETQNNSSVENAKNSDVILFVWASNTHAVYRAFDNSRAKLVYVQGKGASSIVITLEKWAIQN